MRIILLLGLLVACSNAPYKISDHYDGKKFFNPWGVNNKKTLWDLAKWNFYGRRATWPKSVPNPELKLLPQPTSGVNITWVNHSTFLIQTPTLTILTDPAWCERTSPVSFAGPKRIRAVGIPWEKLPKVDVVVVSHNHYDHMDIDSLVTLSKRDGALVLVPLGDAGWLREKGVTNIAEKDWWDVTTVAGATFTFLPAQHWSARWLWDKNESLWGAWGIDVEGVKLYHAGDTGLGPHFKETRERFGTPDLAMLPIGAYEPRWFMKEMHMNPSDAVEAFKILGAKRAVGMHFATFQLTDEEWDRPVRDLAQALEAQQVPPEAFFAPTIGESFRLSSP
ncbi:MAG: MBL fold metallo-hydrolase [Bacteriovoracia bacterium]